MDFYLLREFLIPTQGRKSTLYRSLLTSDSNKSASFQRYVLRSRSVSILCHYQTTAKHRANTLHSCHSDMQTLEHCVSLPICQFPDSNLFIVQPSSHSVCFMSRTPAKMPLPGFLLHGLIHCLQVISSHVVLAVAAGLLWH